MDFCFFFFALEKVQEKSFDFWKFSVSKRIFFYANNMKDVHAIQTAKIKNIFWIVFLLFFLNLIIKLTSQKSHSITYYTFQKSIYFLLLSVTFLFDWSINVLFDLISFCIVYKCVVDYVFYPFGRTNEGNLIFRFEVGHSCKLIYKRLDQPIKFVRRIIYQKERNLSVFVIKKLLKTEIVCRR